MYIIYLYVYYVVFKTRVGVLYEIWWTSMIWIRRAVGSIPTRGPCAAFFAVVPG
jgi:hypothetical protein